MIKKTSKLHNDQYRSGTLHGGSATWRSTFNALVDYVFAEKNLKSAKRSVRHIAFLTPPYSAPPLYEISHFFLFKHSISFIHRKLNSMQLSSINVIYGD